MEENKSKQLKKQKTIAFIAIGVFLLIVTLQVFFSTHKNVSKLFQHQTNTSVGVGTVVFEQPKLYIFGELQYINEFPDRVHLHSPYFIVVTPADTNHITTVYNMKTQKKIAQFKGIGLDYFDGDFLSTQNKSSFFNNKKLGVQCDQGFIQSKTEVYCITAKNDDPLDNKLILINPQSLSQKDVYSSANFLESVSVINGGLYISELNVTTHQAYITVGNKTIEVPTQADIMYPMGTKVYYATFKVTERNQDARYYQIETKNNELTTKLVEKGKVIF
jgi:hypothetical protein